MSKNELINVIWKKKIYIIAITVIFAITGVCYNLSNAKYLASQKFLINAPENEEILKTSKEVITGSTVLDEVIKNMNLNMSSQELLDNIEVNQIESTDMIEIKVFGEDSEEPQKILNELAEIFKKSINSIYENVEIYIVDQSGYYYNGYSAVVFGILSTVAGFLLATLLFVIELLLDNKIRSCKDIEEITGLKTLITIPSFRKTSKRKKDKKIIRRKKHEVFKTLMTNIQFLNINNLKSKSILITSTNSQDGKTYIANNLGIEFAKAGKKVILIDTNMKKGKLAKIFNLPNDLGFSNYLSNLDSNGNNINDRITRFINDTEIKNLNVITAGNIPPNPVELLKANKVKQLIKDLKVFYDIIIFDSISVLDGPEANILTKVCDLTLILSSYNHTKKKELFAVYEKMRNVDDSVISIVLNKAPERKKLVSFKSYMKQKLKGIANKVKLLKLAIIQFKKVAKLNAENLKIKAKARKRMIKEYLQKCKNKHEGVKLIGPGKEKPEDKNNIIKDVYESKISQIEDVEKTKIEEPKKEIKKLELPKLLFKEESQKRETIAKQMPKVKQQVINQERTQVKVDIPVVEKDVEYEMIDFRIPENLTEENIRKQVEMDEMVRLAEKEEEEAALKIKQQKYKEKVQRKKEIQEKIVNIKEKISEKTKNITSKVKEQLKEKYADIKERNEESNDWKFHKKLEKEIKKNEEKAKRAEERAKQKEKIEAKRAELKIQKDAEKVIQNAQKETENTERMAQKEAEKAMQIAQREVERAEKEAKIAEQKVEKEIRRKEQKERLAKEKEEKRILKENKKKKQREEMRIKEELDEDNLYPKPKI